MEMAVTLHQIFVIPKKEFKLVSEAGQEILIPLF